MSEKQEACIIKKTIDVIGYGARSETIQKGLSTII